MLKKVIEQLSDEQFSTLQKELVSSRGEKFARLLKMYRQPELEEEEIREKSETGDAAFYTLKSRLQDKVREFLFRNVADDHAELLKNIWSVPLLVYSAPRETAISMLEHLESQLKILDMPRELANVYNGLKKLHLYSDRFYHYQQLYNKNVAYALSLDKADELVSLFTRELGYFLLSQDIERLDILRLYLKELSNLNRLYDSHRLKVYRLIALISYILFTNEEDQSEETTEELLRQMRHIFDEHPNDELYRLLYTGWHFLNFEYYRQLGLHRNANASFDKLEDSANHLFMLNHTCVISHFLLTRCEREKITADFMPAHVPESADVFSFVNYSIYRAALAFSAKEYTEASVILNNMVNEISFKNYPFAEFQVKMLLSLNLLLAGKTDQAEVWIRSISRKLASDEFSGLFPAAAAFSRFLKTALQDNTAQKEKKLVQLFSAFKQVNTGRAALLKFVRLDDSHYKLLAR